jgi:hypothetical protein
MAGIPLTIMHPFFTAVAPPADAPRQTPPRAARAQVSVAARPPAVQYQPGCGDSAASRNSNGDTDIDAASSPASSPTMAAARFKKLDLSTTLEEFVERTLTW